MPRSNNFEGLILPIGLSLLVGGCTTQPVCMLPPRYTFRVDESQVPTGIKSGFRNAYGEAKIEGTELYIAGDRLLFYVFRFEADGRHQEALILPSGKLEASFDSQ
jgi:hypothetical protein